MTALLLYCRPGFEKECLAEITYMAGEKGYFGWSNLLINSGFVIFETENAAVEYFRTCNDEKSLEKGFAMFEVSFDRARSHIRLDEAFEKERSLVQMNGR